MIHFSLFSGIGGFDLAAEWMGWDNYLSCEIEDFPNQVLNHYWPEAYHHRDIKNLDYDTIQNELTRRFGEWRTKPVVLTGGFPCQPYSQAGQRKGKEDERHLWPEMLRLIHEIQPDFIVGENVFGLLNWNGGLVFDEVLTDLGSAGYDVTPLVIPAAAVNAPHGRDRIWFVATNTNGNDGRSTDRKSGCKKSKANGKRKQSICSRIGATSNEGNATHTERIRLEHPTQGGNIQESTTTPQEERRNPAKPIKTDGLNGNATNSDGNRSQGSIPTNKHKQQPSEKINVKECVSTHRNGIPFENFPTQSPICGGNDGLPTELDGITFSKWRKESIKGYGNAIVPQVVYEIFKAIELAYSEITK